MVIFNSYVKLPEGIPILTHPHLAANFARNTRSTRALAAPLRAPCRVMAQHPAALEVQNNVGMGDFT